MAKKAKNTEIDNNVNLEETNFTTNYELNITTFNVINHDYIVLSIHYVKLLKKLTKDLELSNLTTGTIILLEELVRFNTTTNFKKTIQDPELELKEISLLCHLYDNCKYGYLSLNFKEENTPSLSVVKIRIKDIFVLDLLFEVFSNLRTILEKDYETNLIYEHIDEIYRNNIVI